MGNEKLYARALKAGFDNVKKDGDKVIVEHNSTTTKVEGVFDKGGQIKSVTSMPTILCLVLGVITFPLGTAALAVYYLAKVNGRKNKARMMMQGITE
jgi:hypothetical protein